MARPKKSVMNVSEVASMPTKRREDYVKVRLTAKGREIAGGHPLIVAGSVYMFEFTPDKETGAYPEPEVTRAFDLRVLQAERRDGEPLFEIVPEEEVAPSSGRARER